MHQGNKTTHFKQEILMKCYIQGVPINIHQGNKTTHFRQEKLMKCYIQVVPKNMHQGNKTTHFRNIDEMLNTGCPNKHASR